LRFEGLSVHEAAQVLGATEGAVKLRAFRAYEALREALAGDDSKGGSP
jgi:RNA polymerase sigma-70 factor (ECF subfamily)